MWSLENLKTANQLHRILVGEECIVGRKDAKVLILNDPSVSRKHATIYVNHSEKNMGDPSNQSILCIKDEGSKYGTFKNGVRLEKDKDHMLNTGDTVKFGQFQSEYRVCFTPLVVTTSCLENSIKRQLRKSIHELGGHLILEWRPSCTHLVMSEVKVTMKALCCLVSAKPIVLPAFFMELASSYKNSSSASSSIVDPEKFLPPTGEALIENASFAIDNKRKQLFKDKTFVFLDEKQFKKFHLGITIGGGNAVIFSEEQSEDLVIKDGVCVVQPVKEFASSQARMTLVKQVSSLLQSKKKRMIPEPDVGFAVAYCSTEKFCNPDFSVGSTLFGSQRLGSQTFSCQEVYVPDTEENKDSGDRRMMGNPFSLDELSPSKTNTAAGQSSKIAVKESQEILTNKRKHFSDNMETEPETSMSIRRPESKRPKIGSHTGLDFSDMEDDNFAPEISSQIPAPIKHELDNIFETLIKVDKSHSRSNSHEYPNESLPPTLPNESLDVTEEDPKVSQSPLNVVPIESEKQNGLMNGTQTTNHEKPSTSRSPVDVDDIPRNLAKVQFASLVISRPKQTPLVNEQENRSVKNFKKFKKVLPVGARALPKIIGAHQLVAYDKHCGSNVKEWNVDDPFNENNFGPMAGSVEERGEFDWDSQPR